MEAGALGRAELECPEMLAGPEDLSPDTPGKSPEPGELDEPGELPETAWLDEPGELLEPLELDGPAESPEPEELGEPREPPEPEEFDGPREPPEPEEFDVTRESPEPEELNGPGESPEPEELDGTGESPEPEELDGTGEPAEPEELDGTGEPAEPEELDGTRESPEPEELDGTRGSPEPEELDGTREPPEPEELDGTGEAAEPRPVAPLEPRPEEPEEWEPFEPEKLGLEEMEPPELEPEEPSEPKVAEEAAGSPVEAPAAGGAAEEAGGQDGDAGEATPEETPSTPAPAVPEGQSSEAAADSEEEQERLERAALLEEHERLVSERQQLQQASARLQVRLGELLRPGQLQRRRAALGADGQQAYTQCLQQLRELQQRREQTAAACRERAAARRQHGEERQKLAQAEWAAFQSRKKEATVSSFGRQSRGRQAMELIQAKEWEQEQQLREARVENIRLKNEVKNLKSLLYAHGEQGEGQSLLDFEDVKKENQIYRKKINSLTNEVLKLKNKVSDTSHILNHFREKLQLVEAENERRKAELMEIEAVMSRKRDVLIKTKQARDKLWRSNFKLQQECGLLGYEILLRDFEEKMDTIGLLSKQLETLKRNHAALILTSKAIQKKIKEATSSFLVEDD